MNVNYIASAACVLTTIVFVLLGDPAWAILMFGLAIFNFLIAKLAK